MEYEVYIDVFFLTEFFRNLLVLFLAAIMGQREIRIFRLCLAAALGSFWSLWAVFLVQIPVAVRLFGTVTLIAAVMNVLAFTLKNPAEIVRANGILLAASGFLGGGLLIFGQFTSLSSWESLFGMAAVCGAFGLFLEGIFKKKAIGKERYVVRLYYRGKKKDFLALADSGNRLREPVSGRPVSVICYEDCKNFCDRLTSVIYIPYRAVGTERGMLPGIIFEKMEIVAGKECIKIEKPIVAVAKEPLSGNGDFNMLLPEELLFFSYGKTL